MDTEADSNRSGGIASGSAYDTVVHGGFAFDPEKLGWWSDGRFHVDITHIQSDGLSRRRVGDTQGVSNLEAASANRLYSAWYEHKLGDHGAYRLGIIDLNAYFDVTEAAGGLMNSSFGVFPTISANIPASIYPKPGYGAMAESTGHRWQFRAGVFQGDPRDRSSVWNRGRMIVAEAARSNPGRFGGLYKLGAWQYRNPQAAASDAPSHTWGLYGVVVQPISRQAPYRDSRLFVQLGANPGGNDNVPYYLGFGADFFNPISGRPKDRISVGVARAWLTQGRAETTYEITYLYRLNRWLYLQPDLQYVHSPSGVLPNALVALLRAHFEFGD